jgi:hypothetical protein
MKYSNDTIIDRPVAKVVELFDNPDNIRHWQTGFVSFTPISGTPGQPGAKARLLYKNGNREMEMIETVVVRNLPHEFSGYYEMKGATCTVKNFFKPVDGTKTHYHSESEFQFSGFMKVIAWLMGSGFKKQTQKFVDNFKAFAERS